MNLINNTLGFACNYFRDELAGCYEISELNQTMQIAFYHYFGWSRADLVLKKDDIISEKSFLKIIDVITALKTKKPLAQIIGEWEFYGLSFKLNENTLIPRPETEELVQLVVTENVAIKELNILDIGTGTGCIAIALKNEMKTVNVSAFDVSLEALKIATENAQKNKLEISFKQVNILDWKNQDISGKYDVIVSNPPYITEKEKELMHVNVLDFEPELALFVANDEPLLFYDAIADFARTHLNENGKLYFEINENFGEATKQLLIEKGFKNVNVIKDMNGKDRIVKANLS